MFAVADPTGREIGGTPVTMSPEVWRGNFGPKCDVWSLGCVLFQLQAGSYPFMVPEMDPRAWIARQRKGADWRLLKTSKAGRHLNKLMLTFMEKERPTMAECLQHDWFSVEHNELRTVQPEDFESMQSYCDQMALKRAVMLEIAAKLPMRSAGKIIQIFQNLDKNGDGHLPFQEIKQAFMQMGLTDDRLMQKMFKSLDVNKDGKLSFTEFSSGVLILYTDLLEERLQALFEEFDRSGDGTLDEEEAQDFLDSTEALLDTGMEGRSAEVIQDIIRGSRRKLHFEELRDKILGPRKGKLSSK